MTTIYFVRHAESDHRVQHDRIRPLTDKGMKDRALVTQYLHDKHVDVVLSSPYKRAVDTVKHFADEKGLPIHCIKDFRERKVGQWVDDFHAFSKNSGKTLRISCRMEIVWVRFKSGQLAR
ncbi:histidine phosphatase family protein [Sporolactobacillus laevolacticus]|uniref:histidine phosphatase family protein n=1 Tax=Sporolactobacillus laevolacticus TaxID=33018 RepID=UPI00191C2D2D